MCLQILILLADRSELNFFQGLWVSHARDRDIVRGVVIRQDFYTFLDGRVENGFGRDVTRATAVEGERHVFPHAMDILPAFDKG